MTGARNQRKPTFLWQAALILLPVIVLAMVGWFSLRHPRTATISRYSAATSVAPEVVAVL